MIRGRARAGCWQSCGVSKRSSARYRRVGCMMPARCLNRDEPRNEGGGGRGGEERQLFSTERRKPECYQANKRRQDLADEWKGEVKSW